MDHIPRPRHPNRERLKIPLLNVERYDYHGDFLRYPDHQGWTPRSHREWNRLFRNPPAEFKAFLQRWLCFGVLNAMLDRPINVLDFCHREPNGQLYLSTRRLVDFSEQSFNVTGMPLLLEAMILVSEIASSELGSYHIFDEPQDENEVQSLEEVIRLGQMPMLLDPRVALGLITVVEFFLGFGTASILDQIPGAGFLKTHGISTSHSPLACTLRSTIWRLLREAGWCPYQMSLMFSRFNMSGLLFMLHVQRPDPETQHNVIRIHGSCVDESEPNLRNSQNLCTSYACGHRVLQVSTYVTKHCSDCPGTPDCYDVVADIEKISAILVNGSFPLILSIKEGEKPKEVVLEPWNKDVKYIAISHVWSDGLGNVQDNSIPLCQLQRLSKMVRNLDGRASDVLFFWLDTICIPRFVGHKSPKQQEIKTMALTKMRNTYRCSTATLVLDSWLLSVEGDGMSAAEILMRVFSCAWNSRLWTYQEGALPPAVFFHFKDMAFDMEILVRELMGSMQTDHGLEHTLGLRLIRQYNALRGFQLHWQEGVRLSCIMSAMSYRTTTVATDEAICLSTLLDLDTAEIVNTDPGERMQKFWMMMSEVPSVVLEATGPKIDATGLGWAPRSLLLTKACVSRRTGSLSTLEGHQFTGSLKRTEDGLMITARAMVINCGNLRMSEIFHLRDQHGFWYQIQAFFDDHVKKCKVRGLDLDSIELSTFCGGTEVAVLFESDHPEVAIGPASDIGHLGILVVLGDSREGIRFGKKIGAARLSQLNGIQHTRKLRILEEKNPFQWSTYPHADERYENVLGLATGEKEGDKTDWCLV